MGWRRKGELRQQVAELQGRDVESVNKVFNSYRDVSGKRGSKRQRTQPEEGWHDGLEKEDVRYGHLKNMQCFQRDACVEAIQRLGVGGRNDSSIDFIKMSGHMYLMGCKMDIRLRMQEERDSWVKDILWQSLVLKVWLTLSECKEEKWRSWGLLLLLFFFSKDELYNL